MPKFKIREVDNTGIASLPSISNVVYIPGAALNPVEPKLFTTASAFRDEVGEGKAYIHDLSSDLAHHLLTLGMQVVYEGFVVESGDSGSYPKLVGLDATAWKRLEDKRLYDVRFLTTGGYWCPSTAMITCAAKRCDAIALVDTRETSVDALRGQVIDGAYKPSEFEQIILSAKSSSLSTTIDATSFAAVFVPTVDLRIQCVDEAYHTLACPASFAYLCAYARSVQENPMWYAVAGSFRGIIPELVEVKKNYTTAEIEMLQGRARVGEVELDDDWDNVGIAFNPIVLEKPFGYVIWGNRTTKDNEVDNDGTGLLKATSFLNCRLLSTEVAKTCYVAANRYTFEQNNEVLWANFTSLIIPLLDRMESGNGILDYKILKVPTTKKARLAAKIVMIPIEAVEDFDITIELTDSISVAE